NTLSLAATLTLGMSPAMLLAVGFDCSTLAPAVCRGALMVTSTVYATMQQPFYLDEDGES
ncbi:MAG: hypothetical protein ACPGDD_00895, partial [Poseidonia sp.]